MNDVLWAIEGRDEFYITEKYGIRIINYRNPVSDSFDLSPAGRIRAECRGITFDSTGDIIRRPLHKFHNVGEKDWTRPESIDLSKEHQILEKLDGSMIAPFVISDEQIFWGTKLAALDFHQKVKEFVTKYPAYYDFTGLCLVSGLTPIYEWTSPENRIVVPYTKESLTLIALRNMITGKYIRIEDVTTIPVVKSYDAIRNDINEIISYTRKLKDQEGFVIRWSDGNMVKIKADDYVRMHQAKESVSLEKHVLELIFNDQIDDILPLLSDEDKSRLTQYADNVLKSFNHEINLYCDILDYRLTQYKTKKEYALSNDRREDSTIFASLVFKYMQENESYKSCYPEIIDRMNNDLRDYIKKNLSSATKIEQNVKPLIGNHSWNYNGVTNEDFL